MQPVAAEGAIREQLTKLLTSIEFQNSERLCRFMRFVVDAKLRGDQDQVKEYLIGKEVFDRDADYDPRLDPIVRVEARRLRKKLDAYYAGPGAADSIRFELPKGAYVPEIHESAGEPDSVAVPNHPRRFWLKPAAIAVAVCGAVAAAYFGLRPAAVGTPAVVAVIPARWIWTGNDFPDITHDEDLSERLAAQLTAHGGVQVVAWPSIQRFKGKEITPRQMASEFGVTHMIIVSVRVEADGFRVTSYLMDPARDRKLGVSDRRGVALDSPANRDQATKPLVANFFESLEQQKKARP